MRRAFRIYVANETKKRLDAALADNLERSRKGERIIRNLDLERLLLASQAFCGWLFVFPALIGFTLFYFLPTIRAFYIGLTNWNLMRVPKFLGLENYQKLMADQRFWESMWVTLLYS
jgi:ABC-type sugar transport system permease subunit